MRLFFRIDLPGPACSFFSMAVVVLYRPIGVMLPLPFKPKVGSYVFMVLRLYLVSFKVLIRHGLHVLRIKAGPFEVTAYRGTFETTIVLSFLKVVAAYSLYFLPFFESSPPFSLFSSLESNFLGRLFILANMKKPMPF